MLISAHEANNMVWYYGINNAWGLGWTSQQLVSAAEVQSTGGTYA